MKKVFATFLLLVAFSVGYSTSDLNVKPPIKATEVFLPVGNSGQLISLDELSRIKVKDFENLTGKKLNVFKKVGFKISQRQLRKSINPDGTFNKKKVEKYFTNMADPTSGFHLGGFALGFLLWLIGVLIAYLINDDLKASRVKWAWIGAILSTVLGIVFSLI